MKTKRFYDDQMTGVYSICSLLKNPRSLIKNRVIANPFDLWILDLRLMISDLSQLPSSSRASRGSPDDRFETTTIYDWWFQICCPHSVIPTRKQGISGWSISDYYDLWLMISDLFLQIPDRVIADRVIENPLISEYSIYDWWFQTCFSKSPIANQKSINLKSSDLWSIFLLKTGEKISQKVYLYSLTS